MASIKKNFFYSSILTVSNYIFPLLVFPYVSRVLGVTNIGICNFVDGIVNYYLLISMLGISAVGIREIAKVKECKIETSKVFSSLLFLNTITTIIALIVFCLSIYFVPKLYANKELMIIGIIKLISNFLLIEWLYVGQERFKFITRRTIFVKIVYVLSVFLFVKQQDDINKYYFLTCLMITINALLNFWYAKSYFRFNIKEINILRFFKPSIVLGVYTILTSMYTTFNVIYLGFLSGTTQVGYYTTATKTYAILLAFFTAFTNVMLPRMSSLLGEGKMKEFKEMINKSQDALLGFAMPVCVLSIAFAPDIIYIIAGNGYQGAIIPMQIIMPLILIIGYEQIMIMQVLMPLKKDKTIFINSAIGAAVGVCLNIVLIPIYKSVGSAIVWMVSEIIVFTLSQFFVYKYAKIGLPIKKITLNIFCSIPALLVCQYIIEHLNTNSFIKLFVGGIFISIYFLIIQIFIIKNEFFVGLLSQFQKYKK